MSGDDIVGRLREYASVVQRDYYDNGDLPKQAADAIEDLTAERDASRLIINDLTAEVERLRAERDTERLAGGPSFAMPEMEAIKSFLLRYADTQSAATVGNWNDSPRDVLKAVLGDEGQSVIDWVLGGPS